MLWLFAFFSKSKQPNLTQLIFSNRNTENIINDQYLLNNILNTYSDKIKIHTLDHTIYPNGLLYFNELHHNPVWRTIQKKYHSMPSQPKLVHANWVNWQG